MQVLRRRISRVALSLGLASASVLSVGVLPSSGSDARVGATTVAAAPVLAARAAVTPSAAYLGRPGSVFTVTVTNTGTRPLATVEVDRPGRSWTITRCPKAPRGWAVRRTRAMCQFRSLVPARTAIKAGASSSAFRVAATSKPATVNKAGYWKVKAGRGNVFDRRNKLVAARAMRPGLRVVAFAFQVLDVVVDPGTRTPGARCPARRRTAPAASSGHTFVICGRNRTNRTLVPTAARSRLGGTFVSGGGARFSSGRIAPSRTSRILGSWSNVKIGAAGSGRTVQALIGAPNRRSSPLTTLSGYTATTTANRPPNAVNDTASVAENATKNVTVLANDTDPDGNALTVSAVDTTGTLGTVTNNGTTVTYDPNGAFNSLGAGDTATDTFSYTASDGNGGSDSATVAITIIGVAGANTPPVAVADSKTVSEDAGAGVVNVLGNDTDADGNTLAVTAVDATGTLGTVTNNGTDVSYDPDGAFESLAVGETAADTFDYTVSDGHGGTDTATVTVTVTGVNDAPQATDDASGVGENATKVVAVVGNDTDVDGDTLTVSAVDTTGTQGNVTNNGTDVTYDPDGAFESLGAGQTATDTFDYTVSDGHGGTDTATVTMTITGTNDAPAIAALEGGALAYAENAAATPITATGTVADVDSANFATGTLTVSYSAGGQAEDRLAVRNQGTGAGQIGVSGANVSYAGTTIGTFTGGTGTTALVITLNASATPAATQALVRNVTYRNVSENPSTVTRTARFVLTDGDGGTSGAATRTITVSRVNDAPNAANDAATVAENATKVVTVLANDTDADTDALAVTAVNTTTTLGTVTNNSTNVTYDPNGAFDSLGAGDTATDTFGYTVSDGHGGTASATVTMTITGVAGANIPPVAVADSTTVSEDAGASTVNVLGNDTDADTDPLAVTAVDSTGTLGSVTNNGTNVSYNPNHAFESLAVGETATDTFGYTVSDGHGGTDTATVTITITGANDPPVASDDAGSVAENSGGVSVNVLADDLDVDGDTLSVTAVDTTGTTGIVTNNGTDVTYSPNGAFESLAAGETATDTFDYTVSDGHGGTDTATVTMTITGSNDAPVIAGLEGGALAYTENAAATPITATGTVADVDSADFSTGTLTVNYSAGGQAEDRLEIRNQGTGAGQIGVSGATVSYAGTAIGTFTGGTGTTALVITFNASATPAATQALVRNLTYRNASDNPVVTTRTARFVLTDGDGGTSAPATRNVSLTAANDAPVIAALEAAALAYAEGDPATPITATGTVTDVDSANFSTGTLTIDYSAGGQAEDRLEIRNQGTGAGQIGVSAANITYAGTTIGTFTG
ncbi:tandem-95 repeat protein, partial [Nocardioides marmoriginsengisoli]